MRTDRLPVLPTDNEPQAANNNTNNKQDDDPKNNIIRERRSNSTKQQQEVPSKQGKENMEDKESKNHNIDTLVSMGFDGVVAEQALEVCDGDLERAANYLLTGGTTGDGDAYDAGPSVHASMLARGSTAAAAASSPSSYARTTSSDPSNVRMVVSRKNQYSFGDDGRSACTCMALEMAATFLRQQFDRRNQQQQQEEQQRAPKKVMNAEEIVGGGGTGIDATTSTATAASDWISSGMERGERAYRNMAATLSSGVEHASAEQAWTMYDDLELDGNAIRQGILSEDPSHPQGLYRLLYECIPGSDGNNIGDEWACVVMTKTPETVLLCLPPASLQQQQQQPNGGKARFNYVLLDTHPRPAQFGGDSSADSTVVADNAYGRFHKTMEDLIVSVRQIFPIVDLGDDVPELMAAMYNSFDLYLFRYKGGRNKK